MKFKYFDNLSPSYTIDVFKPAGQHTSSTRPSLLKLNQPLIKNYYGKKSLYHVAPTICDKLLDTIKTTENVKKYKCI